MHTYIYNTDLGTFEITNANSNNHHHRTYELWLENEKLGEYATAQDAAKDVTDFNTGYVKWDNLESDGIQAPENIETWTEVRADRNDTFDDLERRNVIESPFLVDEEG